MNHYSRLALVAIAVTIVFAACEGVTDPNTVDDLFTQTREPVTLVYPEWDRAIAVSHTVAEILRDEQYEVTLETASVADSFQMVADGSADAILAAWLPDFHGQYYGPSGSLTDQLFDYGPNFENAHTGLVVPTYVAVDSIADLDANKADFGSTILGIDPGSGVVDNTNTAITNDTYGLGDWTLDSHQPGSDMFTDVATAVSAQDPVVFTGWRPHWVFAKHDLKLLQDPEGIFGAPQAIHTIGRTGLADTNPGVHTFLGEFGWTNLNFQEVMLAIQEGATPEVAARNYIEANRADIEAQMPADSPYFQ